ncbi:MAG: hypothetical protein M3O22_03020 [Pseudomonadota bacterium]|nr:hypothetical protein [Pseudomonadota bacterium]
MTFWIAAAVLTALVTAVLLHPLLRPEKDQSKPLRLLAGSLAVLVPLSALGLYLALGSSGLAGSRPPARPSPPAAVRQELGRLVQHLQQEPRDLEGWILLAETYQAMGRHPEAAAVWRHVENMGGPVPPSGSIVQPGQIR